MRSTPDKNPMHEEAWQRDKATIRREAERMASPLGGSATHSSPAHDIYGKATGAIGGKIPGRAERREAIGREEGARSVCLPPLPKRQPPIKTIFLEDAMISVDIESSPAPTKYCQHVATHRYPHHTNTPLESPLPTGARPPASFPHSPTILTLPVNLKRIVAAPQPRSRGQRTTMCRNTPISPRTPVHSTFLSHHSSPNATNYCSWPYHEITQKIYTRPQHAD